MAQRPNIILITVDALRADHLGFMGYRKNTSSNIDRLAKESIIFTNAYVTGPASSHSFSTILTSTYPLDYQGPPNIEKPRVLISEILQKQGYITASFHTNAWLSSYFGYDQGWDFFKEIVVAPNIDTTSKKENKKIYLIFRKFEGFLVRFIGRVSLTPFYEPFFKLGYWLSLKLKTPAIKSNCKAGAREANSVVYNFISSVKDEKKPFFAWIHYMDVHGPYFSLGTRIRQSTLSYLEFVSRCILSYSCQFQKTPSKNFMKKYSQKIINLYDQGIQYLDGEVGMLIDFLKKENIYQNTIFCFTADHGDEFWEHGAAGHTTKLYNELLHVPLLIKSPKNKNRIINRKVSLIDLAPTLCNLAGIKIPSSFKGKSLFNYSDSLVFHQTASILQAGVQFGVKLEKLNHSQLACQFNNWKYIIDYGVNTEELYNLSEDPKEQNNLSSAEPEILSQARNIIKEFLKKNPPFSLSTK